jgi:HD-GYP domain-containing protein (c-di-GMP phosphodiesterase class II)
MPFLRIQAGESRKRVSLSQESIFLGRDPGGVQISDQAASRKHAEIFRIGELWFIRDLESRNGTFVNEEKIDEEMLKSGDRIRIGSTVITFEEEGFESIEEGFEFQPEAAADPAPTLKADTQTVLSLAGASPQAESQKLIALHQAVKSLMEEERPEPLMQRIVDLAHQAVHAEETYLLTQESEGKFRPRAYQGGSRALRPSRSILRQAMQQKQAILTADAARDARFRERDSVLEQQIHSVLCIPLSIRHEGYGVLYLGRRQLQDPFTIDDLELVSILAMLSGLALENVLNRERQQQTLYVAVRSLMQAAELHDADIRRHCERTAGYSLAIARQMRIPEEECRWIQLGALIHDIGMVSVKEHERALLGSKPQDEEKHIAAGVKLLWEMKGLEKLKPAVEFHHACADGSGWPRGATDEQIPLMGRIVAVANEFDLLTSVEGKIGEGLPAKEALLRLGKEAGKRFNAEVIRALLIAYRQGILFRTDADVLERSQGPVTK